MTLGRRSTDLDREQFLPEIDAEGDRAATAALSVDGAGDTLPVPTGVPFIFVTDSDLNASSVMLASLTSNLTSLLTSGDVRLW